MSGEQKNREKAKTGPAIIPYVITILNGRQPDVIWRANQHAARLTRQTGTVSIHQLETRCGQLFVQ